MKWTQKNKKRKQEWSVEKDKFYGASGNGRLEAR
jgi:hypothetical protein